MPPSEHLPAGREPSPAVRAEIERYLLTGDTDVNRAAWSGNSFLEIAQRAREDLRSALCEEIWRRSGGRSVPGAPADIDIIGITRSKTEPMIRGLFPRKEQEAVLALVERSVVLLAPGNIEQVLRRQRWPSTAWHLANLYLASIGAELLDADSPGLVGLSEETTCYVSLAALDIAHPFADYIVHEVAHIFHNCKRRTAGLPETRRREWLLDIEFRERETFAYSCEAFSRIVSLAPRLRDRPELAAAFATRFAPGDDRVDPTEVVDIVGEACERRNGWKVILGRCAPSRRTR